MTDAPEISRAEAAAGFSALGADARLDVLRRLVRAGPDGLTVGHIQADLGLPASTLAHHLRSLAEAGLVTQARQGRRVLTRADFPRIEALSRYLVEQCCADTGGHSATHTPTARPEPVPGSREQTS